MGVKETGTYVACDNDKKRQKSWLYTLDAPSSTVKVDVSDFSHHLFTILVEGSSHYTYHHKVVRWCRRDEVPHIFHFHQLLTAVTFP